MSRSDNERIVDILEASARCQEYMRTLDEHRAEEVLVAMAEDALERNLQIIGEAANHLPNELTAAHPEVPWSQIRGFRNILVHQYFGVDVEVIRDVVENHLPVLVEALR
ncbi:HepT-like ribonuclease domain-containing protein [Actinomyces haliotis]|uniref:HepT-like ribonuclease domain-containing protein n=1 Tax=Actinomyces haliotis TaxID=1280843 RepID=UPI00188DDBD4|nr:HepT-like ribonuclease domain-containing protein [Actinomyces haliotis]